MNEMLVQNWNNRVKPNDIVYFLGDFSLAIRPVVTFTPRLMGHKIMWMGNHDWCHPANKKSRTRDKELENRKIYFESGWEGLFLNSEKKEIAGMKFNMCHLPYLGDTTDERYQSYRMRDDGNWLLCGHVHEKWKIKGNMYNVGTDVHGWAPVHIDEIISAIKKC